MKTSESREYREFSRRIIIDMSFEEFDQLHELAESEYMSDAQYIGFLIEKAWESRMKEIRGNPVGNQ